MRDPEPNDTLSAEDLVEYHTKRWQEEGPEYLEGLLGKEPDPAALEELARLIGAPQEFEPFAALRALANYRRYFGSEERAGMLAEKAGERLVALQGRVSSGEDLPVTEEVLSRVVDQKWRLLRRKASSCRLPPSEGGRETRLSGRSRPRDQALGPLKIAPRHVFWWNVTGPAGASERWMELQMVPGVGP
jgi:hypothetical protein